jgi:hypothetical protein
MMKFANSIFFSLITTVFVASGCTKSNQPSIPDDSDQAVANVVPAINGGANAANSQSGAISKMFRANRSERIAEVFKNLFFNPAQATVGCGQFAVQDTCSGGVKQAIYPTLSNYTHLLRSSLYDECSQRHPHTHSKCRQDRLARGGSYHRQR